MVTNVTSFGRSGLYDWVVQRFTAVYLAVYFVGLLGFLVWTPELTFDTWRALFGAPWMRIARLAALFSICAHAWIGLWTVATDYLTADLLGSKATFLRIAFQSICVIVMFIYLVWGIQILWGV